jgi:hypothetical protein
MSILPLTFDDRSQHNIGLAKDCLKQNTGVYYWNVLTTRLYYAVFLKTKEIMFDWYKLKYSTQEEKYFFNHEDICKTLVKYMSENNKMIHDVDKAKLFINIGTLKKCRLKADYEELPMPMDVSTFKDRLQNAEDAIGVLNTIQ